MSIRILDIDIGEPVGPISPALNAMNQPVAGQIKVLVRLHSQPLGFILIPVGPEGLSSTDLKEVIYRELDQSIRQHLKQEEEAASLRGAGPEGRVWQARLAKLGFTINDLEPNLPMSRASTATGLLPAYRMMQEPEKALQTDVPLITIAVCSHDRAEELVDCIERLLKQTYPNFEILIVDNAPSNNQTLELVTQRFWLNPHVRYTLEERKGLAWARNRAILAARGEIIAFTDDDVKADPNWLSALWKDFSSGKEVMCVTGLVLPDELETPAQILCEEYANFSKGFERQVFDNHLAAPGYPYLAGQFGTGGNMAFRRSFLLKLGGFDGRLGSGMPSCGGEDLDIFFRTITSGATLVYEPAAIIWHSHWRDYATLVNRLHSYGKGLAAYLINMVHKDPRRFFSLLKQSPFGFHYLFSKTSNKNRNRSAAFPKDLTRAEWIGLLEGPWFYLQSCRVARSYRKKFGRAIVQYPG